MLKEPNGALVGGSSGASLWLRLFALLFCRFGMLALHVVALEEETSNYLKEHDLFAILWIDLQKVVVTFELENQSGHLVERIDGGKDYLALHLIIDSLRRVVCVARSHC